MRYFISSSADFVAMSASPITLEQLGLSENKWQRRKDARPSELLAAALALFVERGYAATRLQDIDARAGVTKGTIYRYFRNKYELFNAVVHEHVQFLAAEIDSVSVSVCSAG